jgi:hypothetical protein
MQVLSRFRPAENDLLWIPIFECSDFDPKGERHLKPGRRNTAGTSAQRLTQWLYPAVIIWLCGHTAIPLRCTQNRLVQVRCGQRSGSGRRPGTSKFLFFPRTFLAFFQSGAAPLSHGGALKPMTTTQAVSTHRDSAPESCCICWPV